MDRAHDDREPTLAGQGKRRRIHDLQILGDRLVMGQAVESDRSGILFRIRRVDAVDLGGLQNRIAAQFGGALSRWCRAG